MTMYGGFSHEKWWFSTAMLNYQGTGWSHTCDMKYKTRKDEWNEVALENEICIYKLAIKTPRSLDWMNQHQQPAPSMT